MIEITLKGIKVEFSDVWQPADFLNKLLFIHECDEPFAYIDLSQIDYVTYLFLMSELIE